MVVTIQSFRNVFGALLNMKGVRLSISLRSDEGWLDLEIVGGETTSAQAFYRTKAFCEKCRMLGVPALPDPGGE